MRVQDILLLLLGLAGVIVGIILIAGARAKARLQRTLLPIGQLVDIGGYRLHINSQGEGTPTVVIDSGQGDFSLSWSLIQTEIASFTRVVTYDRAGLGWSDLSPKRRTVEAAVEELRTLLTKAGIEAPYVLVGASWGGMSVRLFAHKYPQDVVGMVLVDSSHEEQFAPEPIQKTMQRMSRLMPVIYGAFAAIVSSGIAALRPTLLPDPVGIGKLPSNIADTYRGVLAANPKHLVASSAEIRDLAASQAQMRAANITSLRDIPLIVLRHGKPQPMMASAAVSQLLEDTNARLQAEMAKLSSRGKLVVAEKSGHAIQLDQPDLVIDAVKQVVEAVRQ